MAISDFLKLLILVVAKQNSVTILLNIIMMAMDIEYCKF